jgi:hypothetical protein
MGERSAEQQLKRTARRLAPNHRAVDTLLRAVGQLIKDPSNPRYRKLKLGNRVFAETIGASPGGVDFLLAIGFRRVGGGDTLQLTDVSYDPVLCVQGLSALEMATQLPEYLRSREAGDFQRAVNAATADTSGDPAEAVAKSQYRDMVPREPDLGESGCARINVKLGDPASGGSLVERRFAADDVLRDVICFLGSHASLIPEKLESGAWELCDTTTFPPTPLDVAGDGDAVRRTLQSLGLWPSATLAVQLPSQRHAREHDQALTNTHELENKRLAVNRGLGRSDSLT